MKWYNQYIRLFIILKGTLHVVKHFLMKNPQFIHFQKNGGEIRRRLDVMKKMWEEDQLKPEIYTKMIQLSEGWLFVLH